MNNFSIREKEIFEALKELTNIEFVVIGGYAVNTYTLPRFSVDCDLVVKTKKAAEQAESTLKKRQYTAVANNASGNYSKFERLEHEIEPNFSASFDILIDEVLDRRTNASFSAEWIFNNSSVKSLKGKTFPETITTRIIDLDALVVLKLVACRKTDVRDVFMLLPLVKNMEFVKREVEKRTNLEKALKRAAVTILSSDFKKNLEGVYGFVDNKTYIKHVEAFRKLL
ncbi:MAG: hypothetical protein V1722_01590 [Candidatus Micrarchaeota archaeon]